jgi:hypothetical protein
MLEKLKQLNLDKILEMEEAVQLSAFSRSLEGEYEALELPVPDWLVKATDILREEIARRTRASKLSELKNLEAELEGYKTVTEKRTEAQKRLADLQKQLGLSKAASAK